MVRHKSRQHQAMRFHFDWMGNMKKHNIPIGSLVELANGARVFVIKHTRDCDGETPLYSLAIAPITPNDYEYSVIRSYPEESLKLIK